MIKKIIEFFTGEDPFLHAITRFKRSIALHMFDIEFFGAMDLDSYTKYLAEGNEKDLDPEKVEEDLYRVLESLAADIDEKLAQISIMEELRYRFKKTPLDVAALECALKARTLKEEYDTRKRHAEAKKKQDEKNTNLENGN